ncbi:MAG: TetR/AcrR family transcriptional regulator [Pseudomonadota bacterium]
MSEEQRESMRQRITQAADELFRTEGYSTISMRRIASAVGCTPMTLYRYYGSKIDILRTLWGRVFEAIFSEIAEVTPTPANAEHLTAISQAYVRYWIENPEHYRLVFMSEGVSQPDVSVFIGTTETLEHFRLFLVDLETALGSDMSSGDLKQAFDLLLCLLHGVAHTRITMSGYPWSSPDQIIENGVRALIKSGRDAQPDVQRAQ